MVKRTFIFPQIHIKRKVKEVSNKEIIKETSNSSRSTGRIKIITSEGCPACHFQKNILKIEDPNKKRFRTIDIETMEGKKELKRLSKSGIKIEAFPTFLCNDLSCKEEGAKGKEALKHFEERNKKK